MSGVSLTAGGTWPPEAPDPLRTTLAARTLTAAGLTARDLSIEAILGPDGPAATLDAALWHLPGEPADAGNARVRRIRPYRLALTVAPETETQNEGADAPPRLALSGRLRSSDAEPALALSLDGWMTGDGERGLLRLAGPPVAFSTDPEAGLQPQDLYRGLGDLIQGVSGTLGAKGSLAWNAKAFTPDLEILVKDVTARVKDIPLTGINAVIVLDRLWPPRSPVQDASIAAVDLGLPLTDVLVSYFLDGRGRLILADATLTLAGGRVSTRSVAVPLSGGSLVIPLTVSDLLLADLVSLTKLEGLSATGSLSGRVPLRIEDDGTVWVDKATLETTGPGLLRYKPPRPPEVIAGGNQGVLLVLLTLDNFHYKALRVSLDGESSGDLTVGVHLSGHNPDVYGGYPFEVNLDLGGALGELVRENLRTYTIPDRIKKNLDRFLKSLPRR